MLHFVVHEDGRMLRHFFVFGSAVRVQIDRDRLARPIRWARQRVRMTTDPAARSCQPRPNGLASALRYTPPVPKSQKIGAARVASAATGTTAAVAYGGPAKVLSFGFPFETIGSAPQRAQVMAAALTFFAPTSSAAQWVLF